jgi:hypothetical protein
MSQMTKQGAHARGHPHARTHPRAHTHKQICNIYCFSTGTMIRKCTSVLRYTYIACLVYFLLTVYIHIPLKLVQNLL